MIAVLGLLFVLAGLVSYLILIFVLHRFTYQTWMFDAVVGVRDQRGAPWYDRILYGAERQDISMPAALVIDRSGKIIFAYRSTRLDNRARLADILADLQ